MYWSHQCDLNWLSARKNYLTASVIRSLLPHTATGRSRSKDQLSSAMLAAWADQMEAPTICDINSHGAMARGHVLEPWAISEFNKHINPDEHLYHWDDKLIHDGTCAYSPDALNVPPIDGLEHTDVPATILGEVKSYQASKHYATAIADKMTLEERWQIATAMLVTPSIEKGYLILFNPSAQHPLFYHTYTRENLAEELVTIVTIATQFNESGREFMKQFNAIGLPSEITEGEIIGHIIAAEMVVNSFND